MRAGVELRLPTGKKLSSALVGGEQGVLAGEEQGALAEEE
jgi:hypothetical protein